MAANKFATMLHKNTNRITLVLAYALLEWILIVLLLLNSLFSYLIIKFADYFGLKRPCLWCSRLDHVFEPSKNSNSYRDLVCDDHANEISRVGYCSNHRKLVEYQDMCEDCLSSTWLDCCDLSKKLAFSPWMKQVGLIQHGDGDGDEVLENSEEDFKCSCCGVMLEKKWNLIAEDGGFGDVADEGNASDVARSDILADFKEDEQRVEENNRVEILSDGDDCNQMDTNEDDKDAVVVEKDLVSMEEEGEQGSLNVSMDVNELTQVGTNEEESPEIQPVHLEFYIEGDDCHLIPVELMDSVAMGSQRKYNFREEELGVGGNGDVETIQFKTMTVETCDQEVKNHLSVSSQLNEIEHDKVLDTPTSMDSIHLLHKKSPLLEKRELGMEDSLDASVLSGIECADGVLTVEKLKSALKAERNALNALYTELEEERSASAVAASQTMAMINRLQAEKATMQMEALQYQRMMEEQSEYDQEALQLLNELMVKREKEKAELEKELEIYRKRVQDYETKEKMIMRRRNDDSTRSATSASCSDGKSVDLNHEPKEGVLEMLLYSRIHQNTYSSCHFFARSITLAYSDN